MFSNIHNLFKSKEQLELTRLKDECKNALTMLNTKNMKTDNLDDIKLKIINFKTNYDNFIKDYQKASFKEKGSLYYEVKNLKNSFDTLEEEFIIRYLNHLALTLNGTVHKTNNLKKGYTYYRLENYELKKLGVFDSKTSNHSNDIHLSSYNTFDSLTDTIDMYDREKYYIEVKPEDISPGTPGGKP